MSYDSNMDSIECDECHAIRQEFQKDLIAAKLRLSDLNAAALDLATWVREIDEQKNAGIRDSSNLWKTWRRAQEHRVLTGHRVAMPVLPPKAMMNPN